mmetsp:Transcript_83439/g.239682  ORF Transcript_83439/g.239682 Transcript_83439/m.239682 type:complete len:190 (-) Transcript_83439:93-662(-)
MGAIFCCCPPKDGGDDEQMLAPLPKVKVGKRGTHVKNKNVEEGIHLSGEGTALADTLIEQDAAYWEVKIISVGVGVQVGVSYDLSGHLLDSQIGDKESSWALCSGPDGKPLEQGDVIGVAYGQGDIPNLRFFHNGTPLEEATVLRIRGEGYPSVSVCSGAEILWVFDPDHFANPPPGRHTEVRPPRKML